MIAGRYHQAVAHFRGRLTGLGLDWSNQPSAFKSYEGLESVPLPRQAHLPELSLWETVSRQGGGKDLGVEALSTVLFHAAGLTRSASHKGGQFFYRACPSAGALYPCETYLAWPGQESSGPGLKSGLYHYDVARHALTRLRSGFPQPEDLGLPERSALPGEALFFVTAIFFRSAWKYRARAYRYLNLDAGHVVEGLALGLCAHDASYRIELDFDDDSVADFLGVDPSREGCLAVIRFGAGKGDVSPDIPGPLPDNTASRSRCALLDDCPPELSAVHAACSALPAGQTGLESREQSRLCAGLLWRDLPPLPGPPQRLSLFAAMAARRSRRNFIPGAAHMGALTRMLTSLRGPLYPPVAHPAEDACAIAVLTGVDMQPQPGLAMFDRMGLRLGLRRDGDMRSAMAAVCLDQLWMRGAAMHVLFMTDFAEIEPNLGNRGYRASLQAAGRLGHRLWLAAESLGLGACGVGAFFDVEAAELLGLPENVGLTYVMTLG